MLYFQQIHWLRCHVNKSLEIKYIATNMDESKFKATSKEETISNYVLHTTQESSTPWSPTEGNGGITVSSRSHFFFAMYLIICVYITL
jgi:hypothetical protein